MSVTLVSGGSSNASVTGATPSRAKPPVSAASAPAARPQSQSHRPPGISRDAATLKKLKDLQTAQPAAFKSVSSEITAKLKTEADTKGGDVGQKLGQLADKFAEAARTGDMSALRTSAKPANTTARGADAYRQTAARFSGGSEVEQIISDALKDLTPKSA